MVGRGCSFAGIPYLCPNHGAMDIIYIEQSPPLHRDLCARVSNLSHTKAFGDGERVYLHEVRTARDLIGALRAAIRDCDLVDNFMISRDNTFVHGEFNPFQPACAKRSLWLRRKGDRQEAMIATIGWLLDNSRPTKDYEAEVPHVFSKGTLLSTLEMMDELPTRLLHTLHFNRFGFEPQMVEDPYLDTWTWNHEPPSPVVTLGEACFKNVDCIRWIKRLEERLREQKQDA